MEQVEEALGVPVTALPADSGFDLVDAILGLPVEAPAYTPAAGGRLLSLQPVTERVRGAIMKPLIAIVGRPNVGKSMLFNKLVGQRLSIVEDTPASPATGCTPRREWRNRKFDLVDTGGIEPSADSQILAFMRQQAEIAIQHATVILFVCDIKTGLTASDQEVANMLLRSQKPVVLAVNKMDQVGITNPDIYEFYNLGLGDPIAVSAVHGHGTGICWMPVWSISP